MFKYLKSSISDLFFPKTCFGCRRWGSFICQKCSSNLGLITTPKCIICNRPSRYGLTHPGCRNKFSPHRLITYWQYQNSLCQKVINYSKRQGWEEPFGELAELFCEKINLSHQLNIEPKPQLICPIPASQQTLKERGFNQAETFAKVIANSSGINYRDILMKTYNNKPQKLLDKEGRRQNVKNLFSLSPTLSSIPDTVLLIDDIITTGATFNSASKCLIINGVKNVICLSFAS